MANIKYNNNQLVIDLHPDDYFTIQDSDEEIHLAIGRNMTTTGLIEELKRSNTTNSIIGEKNA